MANAKSLFDKLSGSSTIKLFYVEDVPHNNLPTLPTVPGTMALHQVVCSAEKDIAYRRVSCFCSTNDKYNCDCYATRRFSFGAVPAPLTPVDPELSTSDGHSCNIDAGLITVGNDKGVILAPIVFSHNLKEQHCIVEYEGNPYPGLIMEADESDVWVRSMHRVGRLWQNRFYWPTMQDDCWYSYDAVLALIPEPVKVGSKHREVEHEVWARMAEQYLYI